MYGTGFLQLVLKSARQGVDAGVFQNEEHLLDR